MTDSEVRLPPGELQRLAECVLEPIRFPSAIQPHGALLVAGAETLVITRVSDNARDVVGANPVSLLGRELSDLVGSQAVVEMLDVLDPSTVASNPVTVVIDDQVFDAIVHLVDDLLLVEFEPLVQADLDQVAAMRASFRRLSTAKSAVELWNQTAVEVQRITGFEHVMVYHFHPDEHGEIVAEVLPDDMESYLGLHYPASDIPAQARDLYLTKLSRPIVNSGAAPAGMLSDANVDQPAMLDMSCAELRAVSPHHLEFMRNMGQVSTFSLSIVRRGRLVGMITCANRTERRLLFGVREGLEILANQISLQLGSFREIERLGRRDQARDIRGQLLAQVAGIDDIASALLEGQVTVLDLIPADGAAVRLGGVVQSVGAVPSYAQISALADNLMATTGTLSFASSAVPLDYPEFATELPGISGLLVRSLGRDGDFIAWYRGEVRQSVSWLGDMSPDNRLTPLSPRNSFSAWTEDVLGTALAWGELEVFAAELCRDLDSALLHRAESELAELALRDPLTGLPNRRLFMDRLEHALHRFTRGDDAAVLFIDLDHFKSINDTLGHAAGDEALMAVAGTLTAVARSGDTIARLGGDEFVVLCEHATQSQSEDIATRMLLAIRAVAETRADWQFSASIGVAMFDGEATASQLLTLADQAMYRAKLGGRDRIMSS